MNRLILGLVCSVAAFGQVHIAPTTRTENGTSTKVQPERWTALGFDLKAMISRLYKIGPNRIDFPIVLDDGRRYDFEVPAGEEKAQELVKQAVQQQFHIAVTRETRPQEVFVLGSTKALHEAAADQSVSRLTIEDTQIKASAVTMEKLASVLEERLCRLVVDETNLKGRYDFDAHGTELPRMLQEQLGLTLTPTRRQVEILVVK